jgi:glyoxalase/bleomycin resistance protein/dioxygenase superfamily protein
MKLTPVLIVDAIEPCLPFWVDRLGFAVTVSVPLEERLGFVILVRDGAELMYQTRASVAADAPATLDPYPGHSVGLFVEVPNLDDVERALNGVPLILPRRTTFYGMHEIGVREPGGNAVIFAQPA